LLLVAAGFAHAAPRDLDSSFGAAGKVTTDIEAHDSAQAVWIDAQGRVVVAGTTAAASGGDFLVARYMPDGTLDPLFGDGGIVRTDFNGRDDRAAAVELDLAGRIVVAGTSTGANGGGDAALARYLPSGRPDPSFGNGGKSVTDIGAGYSSVHAMTIDPEGRILVAGRRDDVNSSDPFDLTDFVLARFDSGGDLDPSFGGDGTVTTDFNHTIDTAYAVAVDPQGRIVAAGKEDSYGETSDFGLARYRFDGRLDPLFGTGGKVETSFANDPYDAFYDSAYAVAVDDQNRVVAAGGGGQSGDDFALARYDASGGLDSSFKGHGKVETSFPDFASASALEIDAQGRIVAAGGNTDGSSGQFALARYLDDGTRDTSFGVGGTVRTAFGRGTDASAHDAAIDSGGRIVAVGAVADGTETDLALARYTGLDRNPPDVKVKGHSRFRTRSDKRRARFRLKASEPASFRCKLDHAKFRRCSSPYRTRRLVVGRHRLKVRATDDAGNTRTDKKRFRIVEKR
jgi:uncharacterized delta-60 repeat protein